jgi:hypothetical protein
MNNEQTRNLKENLGERLRRSRESLDELRAETQAKARRAVRITNNYAHDHPWRMVATGAALAFAVGLLMRRTGPKKIVLGTKKNAPVVKVKKARASGSAFDAIQALMPIALMAFKAYQHKRADTHPKVDTSTPVM